MDSYILLLHETAMTPDISPEEMQAIIGRYKAWGQKMREAGRMAGGNKLEDRTGCVVRGEGARMRVTDGPYAETKDVGGWMTSSFWPTAMRMRVEWCKDCPHLSFGTIELRRIQVT